MKHDLLSRPAVSRRALGVWLGAAVGARWALGSAAGLEIFAAAGPGRAQASPSAQAQAAAQRPPAEAAAAAPPLRVVTSFSILADMARVVGGDAVAVRSLVEADADAHVFSPRPAHAQMVAQAELVVVNGLGFEGWLQRLVQASGYKGPVLELGRAITPRRLGSAPDPHAWQDLAQAQRYVATLRDAFSAARPLQAGAIGERAAQYQQQMQRLDAQIRQRLAGVPPERRRVVSPHDAFAYFGAAYGIEFLAVRGRNSDSEASAADVARLIQLLRKQRASAVFVENISDPRLLQRIAREAGVGVGGRLYSDALSAPGTEADTYLKMFAHNANAIVTALTPTR
jgi:zinc/manganese transport system substrate-binding protein